MRLLQCFGMFMTCFLVTIFHRFWSQGYINCEKFQMHALVFPVSTIACSRTFYVMLESCSVQQYSLLGV